MLCTSYQSKCVHGMLQTLIYKLSIKVCTIHGMFADTYVVYKLKSLCYMCTWNVADTCCVQSVIQSVYISHGMLALMLCSSCQSKVYALNVTGMYVVYKLSIKGVCMECNRHVCCVQAVNQRCMHGM